VEKIIFQCLGPDETPERQTQIVGQMLMDYSTNARRLPQRASSHDDKHVSP
jgi:hypothetical protein